MSVMNSLFGRPLRSSEEGTERLGASAGISVFGLDALSSAAYGPEAALALLIPLGLAGISYIVPITICIVILLTIVYLSYRQTIEAYTQGRFVHGAGENLGPFAALLTATALMIGYVLTAAVGISAGVGALVSTMPKFQPHTLMLCLVILVLITLVNLYAVGAFLAFTLSQAGMVAHWRRKGGSRLNNFLNGLGALATWATLIINVTGTKKLRDPRDKPAWACPN